MFEILKTRLQIISYRLRDAEKKVSRLNESNEDYTKTFDYLEVLKILEQTGEMARDLTKCDDLENAEKEISRLCEFTIQ